MLKEIYNFALTELEVNYLYIIISIRSQSVFFLILVKQNPNGLSRLGFCVNLIINTTVITY